MSALLTDPGEIVWILLTPDKMLMINLLPIFDVMVNWYVTYELFNTIFDIVLIEFATIVII